MERIKYYLHEGRPARVVESGTSITQAEYLHPDGTWSEADSLKVTAEGHEAAEHIVLDFWQHHQPEIA